jgi:ankyrin repeat protein
MSTTADLLQTVKDGAVDRLRRILEAEPALAAARDESGVSALLQARYRQRFDMVEAILEHRGDELDVFEAAALGNLARLATVTALDPRAVNSFAADGFTPLQLAAFFAQPEAVALLLQRGANVEAVSRNDNRLRALHSAAAGGSCEIVERLLQAGADVNASHQGGHTPLHAAAGAGRLDMVRALLAHGADPTAKTEEGKTAFELANANGRTAVVQALRGEW